MLIIYPLIFSLSLGSGMISNRGIKKVIQMTLKSSEFRSLSAMKESYDTYIDNVSQHEKINNRRNRLFREVWLDTAREHKQAMLKMLYPNIPGMSLKERIHSVSEHPVYNFLHRYYRYSVADLISYSPGQDIVLEGVDASTDIQDKSNLNSDYIFSDSPRLRNKYILHERNQAKTLDSAKAIYYSLSKENVLSIKAWDISSLLTARNILASTIQRPSFYGCYGLHEWAMLYSGGPNSTALSKHQSSLTLRVTQETIDKMVENGIRCTHFDAFRFFHPHAKSYNIINPINKHMQVENEQPGCVHANMDLFKYAYLLYPLISGELLRSCLQLAIAARKIDMRASPYAVDHIEGCEEVLAVETVEGKRHYVEEQERLSEAAAPLRRKLLTAYDTALARLPEIMT